MAIEKQEPMFLSLLRTLEKEPSEIKAMFFADSESDLLKAYQEGREARNKRQSAEQNPYSKPFDNEMEKYTKYLAWVEGFADVFFFGDDKK